ncbi:Ribosomal RNA small subunit methyltransferase NEP1 [Halotydeus destructor]|nr:Ribosomal RNA small subunit methyltransferase NEP1 [Halotydeus destructor]
MSDRKRKLSDNGDTAEADHESPDAIRSAAAGDSKVPHVKLSKGPRNSSKRLIVVLEKANLEIVKAGNKFELLNCDDHLGLIRKYKKDPAFCRPDITHQCLLMLFDSPLNRAGLLQVYIHTKNNVLIEINPQTRFPRTFKRFANLMVQLLYKLSIRSSQGAQKLLKVIKNPVTLHLPPGCRKIGTSFQAEKLVKPSELVTDADSPVCIVIGAHAHGPADVDYTEEVVSVSQYPLSAALACTKIVSAYEEGWGIH